MTPSEFQIDWPQLAQALLAIIVMSFAVERSLALIFEHRLYSKILDRKGLKAPIAFCLSSAICINWDFDLISILMSAPETNLFGNLITGAVIAGGSKASIKLFHDVLKIKAKRG